MSRYIWNCHVRKFASGKPDANGRTWNLDGEYPTACQMPTCQNRLGWQFYFLKKLCVTCLWFISRRQKEYMVSHGVILKAANRLMDPYPVGVHNTTLIIMSKAGFLVFRLSELPCEIPTKTCGDHQLLRNVPYPSPLTVWFWTFLLSLACFFVMCSKKIFPVNSQPTKSYSLQQFS